MLKTKGPRYRKFKLVNFKGVDEITLDLDVPVTTLIGLNESGKTTILEGIYCFGYGDDDLDSYFREMSDETGIPYQSLINLYLEDCVKSHRKLNMDWAS